MHHSALWLSDRLTASDGVFPRCATTFAKCSGSVTFFIPAASLCEICVMHNNLPEDVMCRPPAALDDPLLRRKANANTNVVPGMVQRARMKFVSVVNVGDVVSIDTFFPTCVSRGGAALP